MIHLTTNNVELTLSTLEKEKQPMIKYIVIPINNLILFTLEKMINHLPESIHNMCIPTMITNGLIKLSEVLSPVCDKGDEICES